MKKVLILTVGGSEAPIIKAIKDEKPNKVIFICSKDEGITPGSYRIIENKYEDKNKNILPPLIEQVGLNNSSNYSIVCVSADDPSDTYFNAYEKISEFINEEWNVIVDYTGGTKSMSAGLFAAAIEHKDCKIRIVAGTRSDLTKVKNGTEFSKVINRNKLYVKRQIDIINIFIERFDYSGAVEIIENLLNEVDIGNTEIENEFRELLTILRGLSYWDRFYYDKAKELLENIKSIEFLKNRYNMLSRIVSVLEKIKNLNNETQMEPLPFIYDSVYDLLYNADRRAQQREFDDAISRIYRALEMYAQITLMTLKKPLIPSKIKIDDLNGLNENIKRKYIDKIDDNGYIKLALKDAYILLGDLKNPVGLKWIEKEKHILNVLSARNNSFLAHGIERVNENDYQKVKTIVWDFINECDAIYKIKINFRKSIDLPKIEEFRRYFPKIFSY